jgi:hypothetical protein
MPSHARVLRSGALSGALTAFVFAALHHILISDIWFAAMLMVAAGALSGASLGWSYRVLSAPPSLRGWLAYNALYLALFALLGVVSLLVYEPIATTAALTASPDALRVLIRRTLPLTVAFTLASAALIVMLYGRSLATSVAALVTCTILTLFLGHNVAVIGLVEMAGDATYLTALFFALTATILAINAGVFFLLERNALFRPENAASPDPSPVTDEPAAQTTHA